jgi:DNA-binding CsgD family transcriptional regulator
MNLSLDEYVRGGWINEDIRYRGTAQLLSKGVTTDDDCLSAEFRKRSPFYQDFLRRNGLSGYVGLRLGAGAQVWSLSIQRTVAQDPFSANEISALGDFATRLDGVAQVASVIASQKGIGALEALQACNRGAFLLNRSGRVVRTNDFGRELIVSGHLQIVDGRIQSSDAKRNDKLQREIRDLFWTNALLRPQALQKHDGGSLICYVVRLDTLKDNPLSAFHALMIIVDTDEPHKPNLQTLQSVFDLTNAEAKLAQALSMGVDLTNYASECSISKETARHHLKNILLKTGTKRQGEMIAVVARLLNGK